MNYGPYRRWLRLCSNVTSVGTVVVLSFGVSAFAAPTSKTSVKTLKKNAPAPTAPAAVPTSPVGDRASLNDAVIPSELQNTVFGQIRLEGMQYFKDVPEAPQLTQSQFLSARLSLLGSFETLPSVQYGADFSGGTFFSRSQSSLTVHEAYLATSRLARETQVSLGRKKAQWSELDSRWQTGLWQPRSALDALRPEEQGLTGLFVDYNRPNFQMLGFVTPIFIPTMGPEIREEGGSLVSDSRWYRSPPATIGFNQQVNSLVYKLDIPEAAKLAVNPGAAVMGRIGSRDVGFWGAGAYGHKPVNDLLLRRQNFKATSSPTVDVTVSPDIAFHDIVSADAGYSGDTVQMVVSLLSDNPAEKRPDPDQSIQKLEPLQAYSANLDWTVKNLFSRSVQLQLGYLKVYGGGIHDIVADGSRDDYTLFDERLKFTNAATVGFQGSLFNISSRPLVTKVRYLYDFDQKGTLMSAEFQYYPKTEWALVVGADLLGVEDESYKPTSFLNQFRANDRVYGGMSYVF